MSHAIKLLLALLALPTVSFAQEITINWSHTGNYVEGFKLYVAPASSPTSWQLEQDIQDSAARQTSYTFPQDSEPLCFGLTAYNVLEESERVTTLADGGPACLGKPTAPTTFSFSAP